MKLHRISTWLSHLRKFFKTERAWLFIIVILCITIICCLLFCVISSHRNGHYINARIPHHSRRIELSQIVGEPSKNPATPFPKFVPDYTIPQLENGMVPIIYRIPTTQNVVFLGIDDGAYKDQSVIDLLAKNNIKASLYLAGTYIYSNPDFFKQIVANGSLIENHTLNHDTNMVKNQDYDQQKNEICGMSDYVYQHYGRRPIFFRPPGGAYSDTMRRAAADCGMKAIVTWIAKANGGSMQYQVGNKLRPGDVVLMHFRPEFQQDLQAFVDAANAAGLQTELLEDLVIN